MAAVNNMKLTKGRDTFLSGAVDDLQVDGTIYDEPFGVAARSAG